MKNYLFFTKIDNFLTKHLKNNYIMHKNIIKGRFLGNKYLFLLKKLNLLYLEDNLVVQENMQTIFKLLFNDVYTSANVFDAKNIYNKKEIDLIICDIILEDANSLEFIKYVRIENKNIPIIITTSYLDEKYLKELILYSIFDYLIKPFSFDDLLKSLYNCIDNLFINHIRFYELDKKYLYDMKEKVLYETEKFSDIKLTKYESLYLELLLKRLDSIVEIDEIIEKIYQEEIPSINAIKATINKLRKKIGKENIQNYSNLGYRLVN